MNDKCETCGKKECTCHKHNPSPLYDGSKYNWAEDTKKKREKWGKGKKGKKR